jgi:hypothetical protein
MCEGRSVPWDDEAVCDDCGHRGAYDFMGDFLCFDCLAEIIDPGEDDEDYRDEEGEYGDY